MMMMEEPTCYETSAAGDNLCWTFSQKGSCPRGDRCRWEHRQLGQENGDPVCRAWLLWGECPRGDDCQWMHPQQQEEGMWAHQCVALPMNTQLPPNAAIIGIVQGPVEWMSYYCEGSEGSPMSAQSPMTPGNFNTFEFFEQCRNVEAAQLDVDQLEGTHTPSVMGDEALGLARVPEVTLEEMSSGADSWDQFEANESSEDLSQHSTPQKLSKIQARVQDEADSLASEIHKEHKMAGRCDDDDRNCEDESTDDEETRFSAVCRGRRHSWPQALAVQA